MPVASVFQQFSPQVFADSYQQGCLRWSNALARLAIPVVRRDFSLDSAADLVCQTAWLGPADARKVLVLISGTHGIEGFAGTAVQLDWFNLLAGGQAALPDDTAMLCINGLNPWGYANGRRCDDQGIDVNRNFIDFDQPLPSNSGYEQLRPLLAMTDKVARDKALAECAANLGQRDFEMAFSGGQYSDPRGPFYGGRGPGFSRRVIETLISDFELPERQLAVVDVHTGLGPYGYGEVICDHPRGSPSVATAFNWYGPGCGLPAEGTSSSVPKFGLLDYAWHRIMDGQSCFVTLEFGTLGLASLFGVLQEEAAVWTQLNAPIASRTLVAAAMRRHFYPANAGWREAVIFRARQVLQQALRGLSE
ncbi:DUF2817 domain-containing protein [Porticoccus sp.]